MRLSRLAIIAAALMISAAAQAQISGDTVKIGILNDMSGLYADLGGQGSVEAARMAVADFGDNVNGKKIEIISADHQNNPMSAARSLGSGTTMTASMRSSTCRPRASRLPCRMSPASARRCF